MDDGQSSTSREICSVCDDGVANTVAQGAALLVLAGRFEPVGWISTDFYTVRGMRTEAAA